MKIKKYRMDQLNEARQIQKDCLERHMPCPPVAWWQAKILDADGVIEERIESKCNSYTRNGLNLIAQQAMYITQPYRSASEFGDGIISYKYTTGNFLTATNTIGYRDSQTIVVGNGLGTEDFNAAALSNDITSSVYGSSAVSATTFDSTTRKLQSSIQRVFQNSSSSSITVTEAGIEIRPGLVGSTSSHANILVVRDVFESPIEVPAGKSLVFTYNFELLYPE